MDELWGGSGPPGPPPLIYATAPVNSPTVGESIPNENLQSFIIRTLQKQAPQACCIIVV
jgi:hypothetical protein